MGAKIQTFSFGPPKDILKSPSNDSNPPSSAEPGSDTFKYCNLREIHKETLAATAVLLANVKTTGEKVAIKKIFKDGLVNEFLKTQAKQECQFHNSFDHPNIVKALEWGETDQEFSLVMEFVDHPTYLKEKIETNLSSIEEEEILKSYTKDILEALVYLHSKGVVHGDLKLENLLLHSNTGSDPESGSCIVKICDFGLSRTLNPDTKKFYMDFAVGSKSYMAPEIKDKSYVDEKIDMWALGIILYKMAVAYKPTQIAGYKSYTQPVPFRKIDWKNRSEDFQNLVAQLLMIDPAKRISAEEALQHPWFQK